MYPWHAQHLPAQDTYIAVHKELRAYVLCTYQHDLAHAPSLSSQLDCACFALDLNVAVRSGHCSAPAILVSDILLCNDASDVCAVQAVLFGANSSTGNQTAVLLTLGDPVYDASAQVGNSLVSHLGLPP